MEILFIVTMLFMILGLAFYLGRKWERMEWDGSFEEQESRRTQRAADGATCPRCQSVLNNDGYCVACGHPFPPRR